MPSGRCSIIISAGFIITFTGATLDIDLQTLTIDGTFILISTGSVGFAFTSAVNIIIRKGAFLRDQTDNNQIYCLAGTVFTFYTGATFIGSSTRVSIYRFIPVLGSLGASFTFGSSLSGPFTFGVLLDGTIQTFTRVTFITRQSGSFSLDSTWLGGLGPTADICASDECGLYIASGTSLSTETLGGVLIINFSVISVSACATFQLGVPGLLTGFRFRFQVLFLCYGTLQDVTGTAGGIFLTVSSNFNFFADASFFESGNDMVVSSTIRATGATIGTGLRLNRTFNGPYFVSVSITGATLV